MQISPIVTCARGWVGTRFCHQGRLKQATTHKGGVDCLGLLIGVAAELNLYGKNGLPLKDFDEVAYPHYPDGSIFYRQLEALLQKVELSSMREGDIALMKIDNIPRHVGIITPLQNIPMLGLLHAYAQARKVVEHALDNCWKQKITAVFRVPVSDIDSAPSQPDIKSHI